MRVILVHPDGQRVAGHIRVGQPYVLGGGDPGSDFESHCPVEIDSLYPPNCPAIGAGTLSALLDGVRLLGVLLHAFAEQGGRVLDPSDGSDVRLDSLFGPLFRSVKSRNDEAG